MATVTDIDGNVYETVLIGEQLWMAENLKVTHYNDGSEIPTGLDNSTWNSTNEGAYAIYDDDLANAEVYGNLYNGFIIDEDSGVCPEGWHVPSDGEWKELELFLGMSEEEVNSLIWRGTNQGSKIAGNSELWNDGDLKSDLDFGMSGFNALPAGARDGDDYWQLN